MNEQVQTADDGAGRAVVVAFVPEHAGDLKCVEQQFDTAFAHLIPFCKHVVGDVYDAVLSDVALFVGELAREGVETDRPQPPGTACARGSRGLPGREPGGRAAHAGRESRPRLDSGTSVSWP